LDEDGFEPACSEGVAIADEMSMTMSKQRLGDFCEFKYGRNLTEINRRGGNYPVYGSNGIVGWHDSHLTNGPAIVIGRKGSAGALQYSDGPCWPIDTTYYVDRSCTDAHLKWLFFMLQNLGLDALHKHAAVPGLNRNDAYDKELLVPSFAEQALIAATLEKACALSRRRRHSLKLVDKLFQSAFLDKFGDPRENPKGWPLAPLFELASKFSDGPFGSNLKTEHYSHAGIRVWRLQDIGPGRLKHSGAAFISRAHYDSLPRHHCMPGDVIVGTLGEPNLRAAIIPESIPESLNKADCVQIRPKKGVALAEYICWLLNMPGTLALARGLILGETRARISMGRLKTLEVPLPPIDEQRDFASMLSRLLALFDLMANSERTMENLFHSLQHRAFRGDLGVRRLEFESEAEVTSASMPPPSKRGRSRLRPTIFIAPPDVEARMLALEQRLEFGPGDSILWSEEFFKYRILGQALKPPFSFREIWEQVTYDIEDPEYDTVKATVFDYVAQGVLEQRFDPDRKEIVFHPRP
jgi:type I restriction enzyme, S subunit